MPIAQRDSEVELAAMNGDLARRGTCLCLVWAHPHPYPLIIIILVVIVIFVIFITIIIGIEWLRCATQAPVRALSALQPSGRSRPV